MDVVVMAVGSLLLAGAAIAVALVVHAAGTGRIAPSGVVGLPGRRLRADAETWRTAHRAATPILWLAGSIAAIAALGALVASLSAAVPEWGVLMVLAAVVLVLGVVLGTWRAHASS